MKHQDIDSIAHELANRLPELGPEAERPRQRFQVERVWDEGTHYIALRVRIDDAEFLASFTRAGQYLTFQYGDLGPHFLVIASAPDDSPDDLQHWEFLIERNSDLGAVSGDIVAGHHVVLSPAEGSGYPVEECAGAMVLVFTTGAGIASVRPLMQYWHAHPHAAPADLALYYGESHLGAFAYRRELDQWRAMGARVFEAVENLPEPREGFRYVQHAFDADAPDLEGATILISGSPVMMEMVIAKLLRLGVDPEHIHINV